MMYRASQALLAELNAVVIVPTYNNAGTIGHVLEGVREYAPAIIVVNDGSTDGTGEILRHEAGIELISYARNRGKGYALRQAFRRALSLGYDYALTLDGDGQHFAEDLLTLATALDPARGELLVGARNLRADHMPGRNTFANRFSNFWFTVETAQRLQDTQSGFRLYPLRALSGMRFFTTRYEFEVEVLVRAAWRGIPVRNVPIRVYYPPAGARVSHFRPGRDFLRISLLNMVLVPLAFLFFLPRHFVRTFSWSGVRRFFLRHTTQSPESNLRLASSMGLGVFCGIVPIWGWQMVAAVGIAHFLRLNKLLAVAFSNISIPPNIPFILYGSYVVGGLAMGQPITLRFGESPFEQLGQYVVGSLILALLAGLLVTLVAYAIFIILRRKPYHG